MPEWIQILQGLLTPVVAFVGIYFAWQQLAIARAKLQHELFDRRYKIFEATRSFLTNILTEGDVHREAQWKYRAEIADAEFLLNEDVCLYLEDIWKHAVNLEALSKRREGMLGEEKRLEYIDREDDELGWLLEQLPLLSKRFKPFLHLEPVPKWPWSKG